MVLFAGNSARIVGALAQTQLLDGLFLFIIVVDNYIVNISLLHVVIHFFLLSVPTFYVKAMNLP